MKLPPKKFVAMPWAFNLVNMIIHERLKVVISMSSRVKTLCSLSTPQTKEHDSVDSVVGSRNPGHYRRQKRNSTRTVT